MCIRDRCNTILCFSTVCIAGVVYSRQAQYHSVLVQVQSALQVLCIRDRCNTILHSVVLHCILLPPIYHDAGLVM